MGAEKLSSLQKAAIVLLVLGEDVAGGIVAQMSSDEVRRIGGALSQLGRVEPDVVDAVVSEFQTALERPSAALVGSADAARKLFARGLKPGEAARLEATLDFTTPVLTELLTQIDSRVLANLLRREHLQTAALVLAHTAAKKAGEVLKQLPASIHAELIHRIATLGPVSAEVLDDLITSLQAEQAASLQIQKSPGGVAKVVGLLNSLGKAAGEALLAELESRDPALAAEVRRQLFTFSDLLRIPDRGVQTLLAKAPPATLRLALKDAPAAVTEHLLRNLSQRAAQLLREDLAAAPKQRKADVEAAQQQLAELAQRLAAEGVLEIPSGDDVYV
ncbi:MAG: flagellar motor switch protein FliG [Proteobacteria bacterium]|nr:flagellar motor switch protein FliG [Pseudomonadota bacterium]